MEDAYLISEAERYDVKGKRYFENIKKYYAMDLGLRNARLNFRQQERSHHSFRKIVILDGNALPWTDEEGITYIGIIPFMLSSQPI